MWRRAWLVFPLALVLVAAGSPSTAAPSLGEPPEPLSVSPGPSPDRVLGPASPRAANFGAPDPKDLEPQPVASPPSLPPPPAYSGSLKPGDWVQVTGTGSCLNVRMQPGLASFDADATVLNCLPDGFVGRLFDSGWGEPVPVLADGHWWWHILGQGWAAEDWLVFHHEGGFPWPQRPELADAGLIAYLGRDGGIWLMNADGSDQRLLASKSVDNEYLDFLAWSPSGARLSFTVNRWDGADGTVSTRIVGVSGGLVAEYAGLAAAAWSPSGSQLSAVGVARVGDIMGYYGTPVVVDLSTQVQTPVGPMSAYFTAPAWSPDGSHLAFVCVSAPMYLDAPDGSAQQEVPLECEGDGLRIVSADGNNARVLVPFTAEDGAWYRNPAWSPTGQTIAMATHYSGSPDCRGYVLVDVETGVLGACFQLPPPGGFGGRCGSYEDGASDWSPDGRYLIYHWEFGAGRNGLWIADVTTGETKLVPAIPASFVSVASGGGHLTFASAGYVWAVDIDGSNLTLLAEGSQPAWQPRP